MARLLGVLLITLVAFWVATYSWNQAPHFECSYEGLQSAQEQFLTLAEKRPRKANEELTKLSNRTRTDGQAMTIEDLIDEWSDPAGAPDPRSCRRLSESLKRLS